VRNTHTGHFELERERTGVAISGKMREGGISEAVIWGALSRLGGDIRCNQEGGKFTCIFGAFRRERDHSRPLSRKGWSKLSSMKFVVDGEGGGRATLFASRSDYYAVTIVFGRR